MPHYSMLATANGQRLQVINSSIIIIPYTL